MILLQLVEGIYLFHIDLSHFEVVFQISFGHADGFMPQEFLYLIN